MKQPECLHILPPTGGRGSVHILPPTGGRGSVHILPPTGGRGSVHILPPTGGKGSVHILPPTGGRGSVSPLYEGEMASLSWGAVEAAEGYVIERNFNESFDQALSGRSWANINSLGQTWRAYDEEDRSWQQHESQTGWGRSWESLNYDGLSWSQLAQKQQSWRQFEQQPISFEWFRGLGTEVPGCERGRSWNELDGAVVSWNAFEAVDQSWQERECVTLPGLEWNGLDARWLSFAQWEEQDLTFDELEALTSQEEHRGTTDAIPIGTKSAIYRIKAYDAMGEESGFLTTDQLPVIPLFYRSSVQEYPVIAGRRYRVLLQARAVSGLERVRMQLTYQPDWLELSNFAAQHAGKVVAVGTYAKEQLTIHALVPGRVWFQSTKPVTAGECFSGALTVVEFMAKQTGRATIALS